jgi:hypothetical protein
MAKKKSKKSPPLKLTGSLNTLASAAMSKPKKKK